MDSVFQAVPIPLVFSILSLSLPSVMAVETTVVEVTAVVRSDGCSWVLLCWISSAVSMFCRGRRMTYSSSPSVAMQSRLFELLSSLTVLSFLFSLPPAILSPFLVEVSLVSWVESRPLSFVDPRDVPEDGNSGKDSPLIDATAVEAVSFCSFKGNRRRVRDDAESEFPSRLCAVTIVSALAKDTRSMVLLVKSIVLLLSLWCELF